MLDILESETLPSSKRIVEIVVDENTNIFNVLRFIFGERVTAIFTSKTSVSYSNSFYDSNPESLILVFTDNMDKKDLYQTIETIAPTGTEIVLETFSWYILCNDTREASKLVRELNFAGMKYKRNIYVVNQLRYNIQKYPIRIDGEEIPELIPLYETEIYPYLRGRILVKSDIEDDDHHQSMILDYVAPEGYTKPRELLSLIENIKE